MSQRTLFDTGEPVKHREVDKWPELDRKVLGVFVTEYDEPLSVSMKVLPCMVYQTTDITKKQVTDVAESITTLWSGGYIKDGGPSGTITDKGLAALGLGESQ